jgi:glucosyl-3-phosphoglycerate synthase
MQSSTPLSIRASVLIPALNEAKRIAQVVAYARADPATGEVIVIDDSSIDATAELARNAGATVVTSTLLGKGASMRDGVALAKHDLLVYLDGDLSGLRKGIITQLVGPLARNEADFVKARFGRSGGRVTELTAKPMLKIFFPELAHFGQPLGGIIAARKSLLQTLEFEDAYGVDIGLLLDSHLAGARLAEVDIGSLEHDSQALEDLSFMANEVSRVIFSRARAAGRLNVDQIAAMYESQRQAAAELDYVLTRKKGRTRLLLITMDRTLIDGRFADALARHTGREEALQQLPTDEEVDDISRAENEARVFRFVHKNQFEAVARTLPLRAGIIEFVNQARRSGFMVGVVSESYFVAAEIIRRRIFADFAMAHTIQFDGDVCNGQVRINPAFLPEARTASSATDLGVDATGNRVCKSNVLRRILTDVSPPAIDISWVVAANARELGLMRLADRAFFIEPQRSPTATRQPIVLPKVVSIESGYTRVDSFAALGTFLPVVEAARTTGRVMGAIDAVERVFRRSTGQVISNT